MTKIAQEYTYQVFAHLNAKIQALKISALLSLVALAIGFFKYIQHDLQEQELTQCLCLLEAFLILFSQISKQNLHNLLKSSAFICAWSVMRQSSQEDVIWANSYLASQMLFCCILAEVFCLFSSQIFHNQGKSQSECSIFLSINERTRVRFSLLWKSHPSLNERKTGNAVVVEEVSSPPRVKEAEDTTLDSQSVEISENESSSENVSSTQTSVDTYSHHTNNPISEKLSHGSEGRGTSSENQWNASDSEDYELYKPGGYHPAYCGETFQERYIAIKKIGWGEFSTVWLASDDQNDGRLVALKISRSSFRYKESTKREADILRKLQRANNGRNNSLIIEIRDAFEHRGPHGVHFVIVLEKLGINLLSLMSAYHFRGLPLTLVKRITKNILRGLVFLHEQANVYHTDIKPENILMSYESIDINDDIPETHNIKISDFGTARTMGGSYSLTTLQTREYRAPEVLLGCQSLISSGIDVWSLGCVIFELLTGDFLFDPKSQVHTTRLQDLLQMNLIMQICGKVPASMIKEANYSPRFFLGSRFLQENLPPIDLRDMMVRSYNMDFLDAHLFCDFLLPMLTPDPRERVSARTHLHHDWLKVT